MNIATPAADLGVGLGANLDAVGVGRSGWARFRRPAHRIEPRPDPRPDTRTEFRPAQPADHLPPDRVEEADPRIIYESEHVRVIHQPRPGDTVVVTFNEIGRCADALSYWGEAALAREGLAAIGVVSTRPNWFPPDPKMVQAIRATIGEHRHGRVVTYGNSQGGYGALKHAGALSAAVAIAFCPQWSIHPADLHGPDRGMDNRFVTYHRADQHAAMRIESGDVAGDAFVLFDAYVPEDAWHAARIAERAGVHVIPTPFTGHSGARFAARGGIGRQVFRTLIDPAIPAPARAAQARRLLRGVRATSAEYWLGRAQALARRGGRDEAVAASLASSLAQCHDDADLIVSIARLSLQIGQTEQGVALAHRALALADPAMVHTVLGIWDIMDRTGNSRASLDLLRRAVAVAPENAFLRIHLVKSLLDIRETVGRMAAEEVARTAASAGESTMVWQHIERACEILGHGDGRLAARRCLDALAARETSGIRAEVT